MIYREAILFHQIQLLQAEVNFLNSRPVSGNSGNSGGFRPVEFTGASDEVGWTKLGIFCYDNASSLSGVTDIVCNISSNREGIDIEVASDLISISFPNLTSMVEGGYFTISQCPVLTSVDLSVLASIADTLQIDQCDSISIINLNVLTSAGGLRFGLNTGLISISLTSLTSITGTFNCADSSSLTTISMPLVIFTNGIQVNCFNCALLAASVNSILARAVASSMTSGTIDLSGGTNAAPTGQGITDAAALTVAGVTVITN